MHERAQTQRSLDGGDVATHGQPRGEQPMSSLRQHTLGVELHAVQRKAGVANCHDQALSLIHI